MRNRQKLGWGIVAIVAVTAAYGVASAEAGASGTSATAATNVRQSQLTPQEQKVQADATLARIDAAGVAVRRQLEAARSSRDVVKTLCLNDKLNQIDVAVRSARDRRTSLEQAIARRDADLSGHEFTILGVLRQRVDQLTAEANQCIGEEAAFVGQSRVTTQIDTNLPGEDPSTYPVAPTVLSSPPPCASCTK